MENENKTKKIISDREQQEYLPLCPVQVKRNTFTEEAGIRTLQVSITPCTHQTPLRVKLKVSFTDARRAAIGDAEATFALSAPTTIPCPDDGVYVYTSVETVWLGDDVLWERNNRSPMNLPEQTILWQTDPLYEQIRRECAGTVEPKFAPDMVSAADTVPGNGIWRCTCGHINLADSPKCGFCGTEKSWLDSHFDREYLTRELALHKEAEAKHPEKKITVSRSKAESDRMKMIGIFAGIGAAALLTVLTVTLIIPSIRYSGAEKALAAGEYDTAIATFADLGSFRDAPNRVADATYRKAQEMTGLSEVYLTTSVSEPWFSITEEGVLSFRKDDYTGSWDMFVVPDMVDGIIVRELDKNFFLNCKDMVSVTLSDCLEVLGEQTFFNCESLTTVIFGKNLHTLGPRTFINCYSLTEITIPDTITKIGLRSFNSCTSLRVVHLGSGITTVPSYLFSCCYALERVSFGAPITAIDEFAFSECPALHTVYYPGTQADWNAVTVGDENDILADVKVVFE